ncbi:MAG TPA: ComEC/Rec2 family competence protein [Mycobacteriales bacterium]|nr:ComEC/Rec2 family competence protein [Mycobacteriales bacterium]
MARAPERPDLRLVPPALAVWLLTWHGWRAPAGVLLGLAAVLALAVPVLLVRRVSPSSRVVAAVCACTAAAAVVTGLHGAARSSGPLAELAPQEASVAVEGTLTADPRRAVRAQAGGRPLVVVRLRVERLEARGEVHRLRAPALLLSSDQDWLGLLPSQRVRAEGRLRPAEKGDDVAVVVSGRGPPEVLAPPSAVHRVAGRLRAGLQEAVAPLPPAERGLLPGLVLGDTSRLDDDVREDLRTVGLTHLTAVSGTNVSIVVGAVLLLAVHTGLPLRWRPVVAGLALGGFVVLARPDPSVLRAAVMGAVGLLALATGTRRAALPALCTAVLVLLLVDPDLAGAPGFALSVLATAGLLVLAPPWTRAMSRRLPLPLAAAVAVPAAAQAACGPVVVALSDGLGVLTVPANLLAAPAVAPATVAGVLAAVAHPVLPLLAQGLAWLGWAPTAWLVLVGRVGADVPGATVPWPDGVPGSLLLAAVTALVLPALTRPRLRTGLLAATTGVVVSSAGVHLAAPAWPPAGWVAVACDVGQGDALVLSAAPGAAVVVDAGPDPAAVDGCLRRLGVDRVPALVLSHLHADHAAGLSGVLRGRRVGVVVTGPVDEPEEQRDRLDEAAARAGVPVERPGLGEVRAAGRVRWQVLGPARAYRGTRSDPNNASLVLRAEVAGVRLLLTGDVEPEAQRDLLERGVDVRADVLKTPHHGSAHQSPEFLQAVGARLALTSVGADNTYGHPSELTLAVLSARGAASLRTDVHGDVAVVVRGGRLLAVPRRGGAEPPGPAQAGPAASAAVRPAPPAAPRWSRGRYRQAGRAASRAPPP